NGTYGITNNGPNGRGNIEQGNFIGTNLTGMNALGNGLDGVGMGNGTTNNTIGGTTPAARNVISGNHGNGIVIGQAGTTGNLVQGNFIGTNVTGTSALGNAVEGVNIFGSASGNTIGGTGSGARNIISGNSGDGIGIFDTISTANTVQGNYIGTDVSGTSALGNSNGLLVGAQNNLIGGAATGAGNLISGNRHSGVAFVVDG